MSKKEKDLQKLLSGSSDNNIAYSTLTSIMSREGYNWTTGTGSHQVWSHSQKQS